MKKILLSLSLILAAIAITGCSQKAKWDHQQKQAMRENLRQYRDMIYLQDLTEPEFVIFTDSVTGNIEEVYPVYATFMQIPNVDDTIDMFVITTIAGLLSRAASGLYQLSFLPYAALGTAGMLVGMKLGKMVMDRLNADLMRRLAYLFVGISGLIFLLQSLG